MGNIIIGTGWCGFLDGRASNSETSKRVYGSFWLNTWQKYIKRFIKPMGYHVYHSNCEIDAALLSDDWSRTKGLAPVEILNHAHDAYASHIMGAQYALLNGCDYVFIEQDCLVYGLDKAIEWAQNQTAGIVYGFGEYSLFPGWSEESFTFVSNEFLPTFIARMNRRRIFETTNSAPEKIFHSLFKDLAEYWPFGYGRKRPIDFDQEVFYAQQITDDELEKFLEL